MQKKKKNWIPTKKIHQLSISVDKILLLTGILQKQRKFVASFVYKIDKICVTGPVIFKLAWEIGSFSGSDGLKGIRTQAKHFLGPRVLFPHLPTYAACVLMSTAIFDHSIFSWLLDTALNRIDYFTNQNTGLEEEEDYSTYGLQELFLLCKFSFLLFKSIVKIC